MLLTNRKSKSVQRRCLRMEKVWLPLDLELSTTWSFVGRTALITVWGHVKGLDSIPLLRLTQIPEECRGKWEGNRQVHWGGGQRHPSSYIGNCSETSTVCWTITCITFYAWMTGWGGRGKLHLIYKQLIRLGAASIYPLTKCPKWLVTMCFVTNIWLR